MYFKYICSIYFFKFIHIMCTIVIANQDKIINRYGEFFLNILPFMCNDLLGLLCAFYRSQPSGKQSSGMCLGNSCVECLRNSHVECV